MVLRLSLRDASTYYYMLAVPPERYPYQGLGPAISRRWWEAGCPETWPISNIFVDETGDLSDAVQPVALVVLMGDRNGVMVGQEVHRNLLLNAGVYTSEEEVVFGLPVPAGTTWVGVYIDDLGVVQILSRRQRQLGDWKRDLSVMAAADRVYEAASLPERSSKAQRS